MDSIRLDKFISNNTNFSRSDVRKMLKSKRIQVCGEFAARADTRIGDDDTVVLDGELIGTIGDIYLMLNKPAGYVSANTDGQNPTVMDLLRVADNYIDNPYLENINNAPPLPFENLQIAGRLDLDTTGMVFITNDGLWNHRVTSPSVASKKTYHVLLDRPIEQSAIPLFAEGILLDSEKRKTRPADLQIISPKEVRLSLCEGKYHQVKRMFASIGNHVCKLHRESISGLKLDHNLAPGQYRDLKPDELTLIHQHISSAPTS